MTGVLKFLSSIINNAKSKSEKEIAEEHIQTDGTPSVDSENSNNQNMGLMNRENLKNFHSNHLNLIVKITIRNKVKRFS